MNNVYFVILCGGGGERLWPLSRQQRPKQFISFLNQKTLLQQTVDRVRLIADSKKNIGVITNIDQLSQAKKLVNDQIGFIITEPVSRNTASAILYSCFNLEKKNDNAIIVFLPADSFVFDNEKYIESLKIAINYAKNNEKILTLGLIPTRPATGYGYIQACCDNKDDICVNKVFDVLKFHEKPGLELAKQYMLKKTMFWNIGVFISSVFVFKREFKLHANDIYQQMIKFCNNEIAYKDIKNISVDFAVMEKSKNVSILPCNFEWDDIGNLDVYLSLQNRFLKKNFKQINVDAKNNLVKLNKEKLIAFVGVDNLCLVEDEDIILVINRNEVEKVKELLQKFKNKKELEKYL